VQSVCAWAINLRVLAAWVDCTHTGCIYLTCIAKFVHLEGAGLAVHVQIDGGLSSISPGHIGPTVYMMSGASGRSQSAVRAEINDRAYLLATLEAYIFLPHSEGIRGDCNSRTWESRKKKKKEKKKSRDFSPAVLLLSCFLVNAPVLHLLSYTFSVISLLPPSQQEHRCSWIPKPNTAW